MLITWHYPLIFLSILVAIIGSFTALTHAQRMRESSGRAATLWMVAGSITLGLAVWSMHFIGMLAFHLPIPIGYDLTLTLLSILPVILATLLGFRVLREINISTRYILVSGLVMGAGISLMHYTGMAALRMSPDISYNPVSFVLSIGIAIIASWGALLMMYQGERIKLPPLLRFVLGAVIMGLAISGMHYTSMLGITIPPGSVCLASDLRIEPNILAMLVSLTSLFWFGGGILATLFDQRMVRENSLALAELEMINAEISSYLSAIGQYALVSVADTAGRIITANDRFCAVSGYSLEELIGQTHRIVKSGVQPAVFFDELWATISRGDIWSGEICNRSKNGDPYWVDAAIVPFKNAQGKILRYISVRIDITKRKKTEAELLQAIATSEAANKELEAFSYSVSHDLRAPLRSVDSFTRIILEDYGPQLDSEGKRLLNIVCGEAQRMGRLIDDLLDFSRMNRQEMKATQCDMTQLVQSAYNSLDESLRSRIQHFKLQPLPPAYGDPAMLRQVLVNLLANALKFTGHQQSPEIEVGASSADGMNTYYVKDNGVGFDQRYVHKLFGVFQRLHSEDEFEGTGIGLALVQRIIHRNGGKVWAEGKLNAGATFYFTLPILKES